MNFTVSEIKKVCEKLGIKPSRNLGQNFLIDKNILDQIVAAGELGSEDTILEIGPGFGVLTQKLVKRAGKVVAVEKDRRLYEFLKSEIRNQKSEIGGKKNNLEIINEDVLKISNFQFPISNEISNDKFQIQNHKWKIISNLPYSISTQVLWKFLHYDYLSPALSLPRGGGLELMVLMLQKEVGERICAKPGKMSILSVLCQLYADCEIVSVVGRNCFWPVPEVDSVIVKLNIRNVNTSPQSSPYKGEGVDNNATTLSQPVKTCSQQLLTYKGEGVDNKELMRIVKIGFSAKRKMLKNNLSGGLNLPMEKIVEVLKSVGLNEKVRAQELGVGEWVKVCEKILNLENKLQI